MEKLCLVFDLDETVLHYIENDNSPNEEEESEEENENENEFRNVISPGDKLLFRPGFWKFIEYVNSKEGQIVLGIWTFGTKPYATELKPYLERNGEIFEFLYTRENMKEGMLPKELNFVVNKMDGKMRIQKKRSRDELPRNIFLVDNLPSNINHDINRKNGILVESFTDKNKPDNMFLDLRAICESLLSTGKIPREYLQRFRIEGKQRVIASIGKTFDEGVVPMMEMKSSRRKKRGGSGTRKKRQKTK